MFYYCTCDRKNPKKETRAGYNPYRMVEVDKDEICVHCGHYTIACPIAATKSGDIYNYLFRREAPKNQLAIPVKGGLGIREQKKSKDEEYKAKRRKDYRRNR